MVVVLRGKLYTQTLKWNPMTLLLFRLRQFSTHVTENTFVSWRNGKNIRQAKFACIYTLYPAYEYASNQKRQSSFLSGCFVLCFLKANPSADKFPSLHDIRIDDLNKPICAWLNKVSDTDLIWTGRPDRHNVFVRCDRYRHFIYYVGRANKGRPTETGKGNTRLPSFHHKRGLHLTIRIKHNYIRVHMRERTSLSW